MLLHIHCHTCHCLPQVWDTHMPPRKNKMGHCHTQPTTGKGNGLLGGMDRREGGGRCGVCRREEEKKVLVGGRRETGVVVVREEFQPSAKARHARPNWQEERRCLRRRERPKSTRGRLLFSPAPNQPPNHPKHHSPPPPKHHVTTSLQVCVQSAKPPSSPFCCFLFFRRALSHAIACQQARPQCTQQACMSPQGHSRHVCVCVCGGVGHPCMGMRGNYTIGACIFPLHHRK